LAMIFCRKEAPPARMASNSRRRCTSPKPIH
jgi:hypothetical protein